MKHKRHLKKEAKLFLFALSLIIIIIIIILIIPKRKKILIPSFINKDKDEITEFCKEDKCEVNFTYDYDVNILENKIIKQSIVNKEIYEKVMLSFLKE